MAINPASSNAFKLRHVNTSWITSTPVSCRAKNPGRQPLTCSHLCSCRVGRRGRSWFSSASSLPISSTSFCCSPHFFFLTRLLQKRKTGEAERGRERERGERGRHGDMYDYKLQNRVLQWPDSLRSPTISIMSLVCSSLSSFFSSSN